MAYDEQTADALRERDKERDEVERLREGLLACARESGADVSDGIPDFPDIVDWAVDCVKALRSDYEEWTDEDAAPSGQESEAA